MIFFTSDLHLSHNQPFLYEPRGFTNIQDHNAEIVKNWNDIVTPEDEVWILGDLMLNDNEETIEALASLKGHVHYLCGNHDTNRKMDIYDSLGFWYEGYVQMWHYHKYNFYLSHYPTLVGNYDDKPYLKGRVINLCGHTHTKDAFADWDKGTIYHVELDAHNNRPISIEEIISDMKQRV